MGSRGKTAAQLTAQGHDEAQLSRCSSAAWRQRSVLVSYVGKAGAGATLWDCERLCTKGKGFAGGEAALVRQSTEQQIETNPKAGQSSNTAL